MLYQNLILSIILFITDQFFQSLAQVEGMSLSIDLIHRDSPLSPFYNHSISSSQLFTREVRRSRARVNRTNQSFSYTQEKVVHIGDLTKKNNNYLVSFPIGFKKDKVVAFLDMTIDFIWTRCKRPEYDLLQSETHYKYPYNNDFCRSFPFRESETNVDGDCRYQYYVEKTKRNTHGFLIADDFSFDSHGDVRQKRVKFGCADTGEDELGVFGFGKGKFSLPHQIRRLIKNKFSYCLQSPKESTSSTLKLGALPTFLDDQMMKSPLQQHLSDHTSYYLNVKGISICGSDFSIGSPHLIKIDLGTPWTYLEQTLFLEIQERVTEFIARTPIPASELSLCYRTEDLDDIVLPSMVFYFEPEASFHIKSENMFIKDAVKTCMSIFSSEGDGSSILGSLAQENHIMQFDSDKEVSFTSNLFDCNEYFKPPRST